jgi:hypothetical protein
LQLLVVGALYGKVSIMIDVVGRCFKEELASSEWQENLKNDSSHGQALNDNGALRRNQKNTAVLKLNNYFYKKMNFNDLLSSFCFPNTRVVLTIFS